MTERKAATLNISKALLGVSLAALAAIGSGSGIMWLAGATALPAAGFAASDTLGPLLQKNKEEYLSLPVPRWWSSSAAAWQAVCSSLEISLPTIIDDVAAQIKSQKRVLTREVVLRVFAEQVAHHLPVWEIGPQDRELAAVYLTPLLLENAAGVLKQVIQQVREDALAEMLAKMAMLLEEVQKEHTVIVSAPPSAVATPESIGALQVTRTTQNSPANSVMLQEKMQKGEYDVYICYAEDDEVEVYKIGEQLKEHGILAWFDVLARPGELAMKQQEEQIGNIRAATVFVGQYAITGLQEQQMYAFIRQYVDRGIPVIPVLLADAPKKPKLPHFLGNFQWVDFRRPVPNPLGQLIWGITGERPDLSST